MRRCAILGAIVFVLSLTLASTLEAADFYVAPGGKDAWSGTRAEPNAARTDGPLATLAGARAAVRKQRAAGKAGATVHLRAGVYCLDETFRLGPEDSGTAAAPVVYRGYRDERPTLVGGRAIAPFVPHEGRILKANLAAVGLKDAAFTQLVFAGRRQHLARWPNFDPENPYGGGWAYADGRLVAMYEEVPGENNHTLAYRAEDERRWAKPELGEVFVFPRYNWWNNIVRIGSVDRAKRTITLAGDCSYAIRPGDRYYVRNLREELDAAGEWYLDRAAAVLYFWPPEPLAGRPVYVPTLRTIIDFAPGTEHVTISNLVLECCEGTAVTLKDTRDCRIAGCTIRNVGDYNGCGVSVEGGLRNGVVGNDIFETGSHAITLAGGDRVTLTPAENYADNNYLHHVGVFYKQGVGVSLNGVGNRAVHNLIHDGPRMGILFSGNNLAIEYNHIRHMNLETEDTGAVYTGGRDWISSRGTVIRYNYFHDILGYGREGDRWVSPHFAWGVYLDDNAGGVDVIGNVVVRAPRALVHLHNGRDNRIENNILVESRLQQVEYNGWTQDHAYWKSHLPTMIEGYEKVAQQPAWRGMRGMQVHPKDAVLPDGTIMSGNVFRRNVIAYRDPKAKLFSFRNLPLDHYESDNNLVYHFGKPLLTGYARGGKAISANLVANPGFEAGPAEGLPEGWSWQMRPTPQTRAAVVSEGAARGRRALVFEGGQGKEPNGRKFFSEIVSGEFSPPLGRYYRLSARFKAQKPETKVNLMLQAYVANAFFWASSPQEARVGPQWTPVEFVFRLPGPGEPGHHAQMKGFRVRIDLREPSGLLWVDDVAVEEVEMLDEWAAWQALGFDRHSRVADPKFVDPDRDDYRLKPDSPAFELGFQPIPIEKIGPYADPLRASWPIVEAEGAREKPLSGEKR